jgi:hypothetical protein
VDIYLKARQRRPCTRQSSVEGVDEEVKMWRSGDKNFCLQSPFRQRDDYCHQTLQNFLPIFQNTLVEYTFFLSKIKTRFL